MKKHFVEKEKSVIKKPISQKIENILSSKSESIKLKTAKGRKKSSIAWMQRHLNDPFVRAAKKEGWLSRAVYKVMQIDEKFRLIRPNQVIVDLGSSPGSWLQYIIKTVSGKNSIIIGIDLLELEFNCNNHGKNVKFLLGDFSMEEMQNQILDCLGERKIDLILSDIAPNTIGSKKADHLAIMQILNDVEAFASKNLNYDGALVVKLFHGAEEHDFIKRLKQQFKKVAIFKPEASRKGSVEVYVVCKGFNLLNKT